MFVPSCKDYTENALFDMLVILVQIDGLRNSKLQSVYFEDMPIHQARFTPDGKEIFLSGLKDEYIIDRL